MKHSSQLIVFTAILIYSAKSLIHYSNRLLRYQAVCICTDDFNLKACLFPDTKTGPMTPADLTPAVDKFVALPPINHKSEHTVYFMTAKGPSPEGPDPFKAVGDELQPLSDYVKELLVSENPVLTMAASHFFDQVLFRMLHDSTIIIN